MLTKPRVQSAISESNPAGNPARQRTAKPALLGVRGRMIALAILPVVLSGLAIFNSVYTNVGEITNDLYERQTSKTVQTLMGNIDFTNPKEIERELKQAMASSEVLAIHLSQVDANGVQRSQLVFRDDQAKTSFESLEPEYVASKNSGAEAEREFFKNFSYNTSSEALAVLRATGLGGKNGATQTQMLDLFSTDKLSIPKGSGDATGFSVIWIESMTLINKAIWKSGWVIIWFMIGSVLIAALASIIVAQTVVRPVAQLTKLADAMSIGDLETPIEIKSRDELGKLGEALERTRLSLRLAIERTQRKRAERNQE
jgi:methyl-accepting chemotaxis protein